MSGEHRYGCGMSIMRREVLHGRLWMEHPVKVVADDGDHLAVLLEPGSPFTFHAHPQEPHPWAVQAAWQATQVLQLHRTDDLYSVWRVFEGGVFQHWYINFEAPIVRRDGAFETDDYGLDLIVSPEGSAVWKDVEHLSAMRRQGRMTPEQIIEVLTAAETVAEAIRENRRWWADWDNWQPTD